MGNNRKCTASKEATPRTTFGVQFSRKPFPGHAKNAYPGLRYLHASGVASPKGCTELSPRWSVLCDTRGFESTRESHPGRVPARVQGLLSLTASGYRLDRTNTWSTDPNDPTRIVQTGANG